MGAARSRKDASQIVHLVIWFTRLSAKSRRDNDAALLQLLKLSSSPASAVAVERQPCRVRLRNQIVDHVAVQIGQAVIASTVVISQLGVVDAELIEYRRVNVVDMHGILDRLPPEIVSGTIGEATLEAAAGDPHGKAVWIM